MTKKDTAKRLGRGLSSLISEPVAVESPTQRAVDKKLTSSQPKESGGVETIAISDILPNKYQPRKSFSDESLQRLTDSIRVSGVIQPVIVRPLHERDAAHEGARWELIAGERRWRAARLAGLETLPAVVRDITDRTAAEWALVENLQREDLNPVERAEALKELRDEFGLTQSQVAEQVGLDRATVANLIRITELEPEILDLLRDGALSTGHAKALLATAPGRGRITLAKKALKEAWSVRRTEQASSQPPPTTGSSSPETTRSAHLKALEKDLGDYLGAKLDIKQSANKKSGTIIIRYFDLDHFESVLERVGFRAASPASTETE